MRDVDIVNPPHKATTLIRQQNAYRATLVSHCQIRPTVAVKIGRDNCQGAWTDRIRRFLKIIVAEVSEYRDGTWGNGIADNSEIFFAVDVEISNSKRLWST